jgi:hypothetical protein
MSRLLILLSLSLAITFSAPAQDLATLVQIYEESKTELMKPVTDFQDLYAENLEKLKTQATAAGKLDEVLAINNELAGFRNGDTPVVDDSLAQLKNLQTIYRQNLSTRLQQATQAAAPLTANYQAKLTELQAALTRQEKLTEALQVKAVLDTLAENEKALAESLSQNPVQAALNLTAGSVASSKFTQGKLHAIGRFKDLSGPEIDLSAADGITDFIDVMAHGTAWAALRKNGDVIASSVTDGAITRHGFTKLVPCRFDAPVLYAINAEGQLVELFSQTVIATPGKVVAAQVQGTHGIALLADHSVHTWGPLYQGIAAGRQPMPTPPADVLKNAAMVAASRYAAFVVSRTGDLYGWGHSGTVFKIPRELKNITRIWAGCWHVIVEVKGREFYKFNPDKFHSDGCQAVGKSFADIRVGGQATLVFHQGKWQRHAEMAKLEEAFGEQAALNKMQDNSLPYLYQDRDQDKLSKSALYWLAP